MRLIHNRNSKNLNLSSTKLFKGLRTNKKAASKKIIFSLIILLFLIAFLLYIFQGYGDKSLKKLALSPKDVEGYYMINESYASPTETNSVDYYYALFDNYPAGYKLLSNTILLYDSVEDLKKDFNKEDLRNKFSQSLKEASIETIGDDSIAFSGDLFGGKRTLVWFIKKNVIVNIYLVNGDVGEAVLYAQKIEGKIR